MTDARTLAVLAVASVACLTDLKWRRIPNVLTLGATLIAVLAGAATGGAGGAGSAIAGWFVGVALFFPIFALRGMGAGDVKLLGAIGAWLGPVETIYVAAFASIAGGVLAVVVSLWFGYLERALSNVWVLLTTWRAAGIGPVAGVTLHDTRGPRLAFAIPIAIGVLCTLWQR